MLGPIHIHMTTNHLEHVDQKLGLGGNEYAAARWFLSRMVPAAKVDVALAEYFQAINEDLPWSNDLKGQVATPGKLIRQDGRILEVVQVQMYKGILTHDIETKEEVFVDDEFDWEWV
jgi:hypothetical protein